MSNKQELQKAVKAMTDGKKEMAKRITQIVENNRRIRREQAERQTR